MPRSSVVASRLELGTEFHGAVARASGDDVFDERPHGDADDRFAGFVHDRAGDDAVLPHPERDVRGPLALGERQELALALGAALAVRPGRIAVLRGVAGSIRPDGRSVKKKRPSPSAITRPFGVVGSSKYFGIVSLTMASPTGAPVTASTTWPTIIPVRWPGGAPVGGDDLRGTPSRQGEHDDERRDPTCLSEPGHGAFRIIQCRARLVRRRQSARRYAVPDEILQQPARLSRRRS